MVVMIGLAASMSCYGLEQYFVSLPADRERYATDPEGAAAATPACSLRPVRVSGSFSSSDQQHRADGHVRSGQFTGGLLLAWLVATLGIGLSLVDVRKGETRGADDTDRVVLFVGCCPLEKVGTRARCAVLGVAGVLMAACLLLTKSRAAVLAVGFGVAVLILLVGWRRNARATLLVSSGIAAAVARSVPGRWPSVAARSRGAHRSRQVAVVPLAILASLVADDPAVSVDGLRAGQLSRHLHAVEQLPEASEVIADPHNFLMEIWATAGTPAALAILAVFGCVGLGSCCGRGDWATFRKVRLPAAPAITAHNPDRVEAAGSLGSNNLLGSGSPDGSERFVLAGGGRFGPAAGPQPAGDRPAVDDGGRGWVGDCRGDRGPGVPLDRTGPTAASVAGDCHRGAPAESARGRGYSIFRSIGFVVAADRPGLSEFTQPRELPRSAALGSVAMAAVLIVGCFATAYRPVLKLAKRRSRRNRYSARFRRKPTLTTPRPPTPSHPIRGENLRRSSGHAGRPSRRPRRSSSSRPPATTPCGFRLAPAPP